MSGYKCGYDHSHAVINREIIEGFGLDFPDALFNGSDMAALAENLGKSAYCRSLPFCSTIEAEALGGDILLGDDISSPRIKKYAYKGINELACMPYADFTKGRIGAALQACAILSEKGRAVVFEVSGPITIISLLIDLTSFFKAWKNQRDLAISILTRLRTFIVDYVCEIVRAGADIISYADPCGSMRILGPKMAEVFLSICVLPLLRQIQPQSDVKYIIHLCPETSYMLARFNMATWKRCEVGEAAAYDEACIKAIGKAAILGENCLNNRNYQIKNNSVQSLILT